MLIGGGRISTYLMSQLTSGYKFKTIEKDPEVCENLAELFPKAQIIMGDAADPDLLDEEGLQKTDACVIMTSDDQTNLIISMLAQSRGVEKVISKLASPTYVKLSDSVGINSTITPQYIVNTKVLRFVRGLANRGENGYKSEIKSLHKIADNKVEALEFDVAEDFEGLGITLRDIKLKNGVLIAAIIRGNNVIYPNGDTKLEIGDGVIVMTTIEKLCDLGDILA
jgi:trk system potassium uptake protein TrkA